jgi:hypothetical protein
VSQDSKDPARKRKIPVGVEVLATVCKGYIITYNPVGVLNMSAWTYCFQKVICRLPVASNLRGSVFCAVSGVSILLRNYGEALDNAKNVPSVTVNPSRHFIRSQ